MLLKADKNKLRQNSTSLYDTLIHGTADRPRLHIFSCSEYINVEIYDDDKGVTLTAASSLDKFFEFYRCGIVESAKIVSAAIATRALAAGISEVVLDCDDIYSLRSQSRLVLNALYEAGVKIYEGRFTPC